MTEQELATWKLGLEKGMSVWDSRVVRVLIEEVDQLRALLRVAQRALAEDKPKAQSGKK